MSEAKQLRQKAILAEQTFSLGKKATKEGVCPVEDNLETVRTLGGGPVQGQELESMIFVGPLQLSIFCGLRGCIEKKKQLLKAELERRMYQTMKEKVLLGLK